MTNQSKGYLFAGIATVSSASIYITSKGAMQNVSFQEFGVIWYAVAFFFNYLFFAIHNNKLKIKIPTDKIFILFVIGVAETISAATLYYAIDMVDNPSVVSFLGNMGPVFVTILGIVVLREVFQKIEYWGLVLAMVGIFIVGYNRTITWHQLFIPGTSLVMISAVFNGIRTILIKKNVQHITPEVFTLNRTVFLLLFFSILMLVKADPFMLHSSSIWYIVIGAAIGPFLGTLSMYYALQYIDAARTSILLSLQSIIVLIAVYFIYHKLPFWYQIIGGIVAIVGVILMSIRKATRPKAPTGGLP